ncbi:REP element-mobilizing transposase RayT [Flavobacterium arsenatis]|uniref:REP element-mobilizing transposase RayT n=1 Tax=Flavobacterium arsenatis TaxID=1484332 RepID=A0ABU1TJF2_9FLAO|nr:transposase [Flavobacterium arsenatis]MDR6966119.1 REP element-mobilizing transposase RayT [Flavobacterium arsenatis]
MNNYNPNKHHRRSIRLKGYDYSQEGLYFITICCQDRAHLFGVIREGKMILNEAGEMVQRWYYELEHKFPDIKCHSMVVMPNHFHCIIENTGVFASSVGADLRVGPDFEDCQGNPQEGNPQGDCNKGEHAGSPVLPPLPLRDSHKLSNAENNNSKAILGEHAASPLYRVVQWFKTMSTNEYIRGVKSLGWKPFNGKVWQRNYYEIIIRNEEAYEHISNYIASNPAKWKGDKFSHS